MTRNKSTFYYSTNAGKEELQDEYGNNTGEYRVIYSTPIVCKGNISAAQGEVETRQFGDSESYDKVIVLDNRDIPIDEYSILWVDILPVINDDGTTDTPHDYIVKKVARSLNSVSFAIRKVNVNG
jgi:hypothetical protein